MARCSSCVARAGIRSWGSECGSSLHRTVRAAPPEAWPGMLGMAARRKTSAGQFYAGMLKWHWWIQWNTTDRILVERRIIPPGLSSTPCCAESAGRCCGDTSRGSVRLSLELRWTAWKEGACPRAALSSTS